MHRLFVECNTSSARSNPFLPDVVIYPDVAQARHMVKVLRLKTGDMVELLDGVGHVALGRIQLLSPQLEIRIISVQTIPPLVPRITVAAAIPKIGRADEMIRQLSQLGADALIPLTAKRCVVKPRHTKLERFERMVQESAKQCGRAHLMRIHPPETLSQLLARPFDQKRLALPTGDALGTPDVGVSSVLVVIGPEGGFTDEEIQMALSGGMLPWRFGPHTLRIETAAAACVAILRSNCPPPDKTNSNPP